MRAALIATALAAWAASLPASAESPLIAYANEILEEGPEHASMSQAELAGTHVATRNLRAVTFEMARHPPPPAAECAHTLGARRFAEEYAELATAQEQLGNFQGVIDAAKSALACSPRSAYYEAWIASADLSLARIPEARAAVERGYRLNPDDASVRDVRARVDFIEEHWADATARFRLQVLNREDQHPLDYRRCFLWLAQRRAGVLSPELPPKTADDERDSRRWPAQILETLQGTRSEADLAQVIRKDGGKATREWLTEALFYVGELRLAEGDMETARRHFATVVNLKVLNFIEYGLARAELAKMRERH